jgi:hypothetical protein
MTATPAEQTVGDGSLYVITLCTASLPMVLRVPFVHELEGFSVFRSRRVENGRERYRLHLGYFDSAARAHEALAVIRRYYPSAWISSAPRTSLGSLDDTMNTAFRMIRRATARVLRPEDYALPSSAADEATPPKTPQVTDPPVAAAKQRYAVQLDWSTVPIRSMAIPRLAVFRAYNLYRVRMTRDGTVEHGLRLGFFRTLTSARQVAEYVRSHFPRVSVVPVSDRECARALDLIHKPAARPWVET